MPLVQKNGKSEDKFFEVGGSIYPNKTGYNDPDPWNQSKENKPKFFEVGGGIYLDNTGYNDPELNGKVSSTNKTDFKPRP